MCNLLTLDNGMISYSTTNGTTFEFGTEANHTCNNGYILMGNFVRICSGESTSDIGQWSGVVPTCAGKFSYLNSFDFVDHAICILFICLCCFDMVFVCIFPPITVITL